MNKIDVLWAIEYIKGHHSEVWRHLLSLNTTAARCIIQGLLAYGWKSSRLLGSQSALLNTIRKHLDLADFFHEPYPNRGPGEDEEYTSSKRLRTTGQTGICRLEDPNDVRLVRSGSSSDSCMSSGSSMNSDTWLSIVTDDTTTSSSRTSTQLVSCSKADSVSLCLGHRLRTRRGAVPGTDGSDAPEDCQDLKVENNDEMNPAYEFGMESLGSLSRECPGADITLADIHGTSAAVVVLRTNPPASGPEPLSQASSVFAGHQLDLAYPASPEERLQEQGGSRCQGESAPHYSTVS